MYSAQRVPKRTFLKPFPRHCSTREVVCFFQRQFQQRRSNMVAIEVNYLLQFSEFCQFRHCGQRKH
jgi:hypothetical protein